MHPLPNICLYCDVFCAQFLREVVRNNLFFRALIPTFTIFEWKALSLSHTHPPLLSHQSSLLLVMVLWRGYMWMDCMLL